MTKTPLVVLPALLLAGALAVPALTPASAQVSTDGATLFKQRCGSCHVIVAGQKGVLAPNLFKVVGRKAGTADFAYSPALKAANITWNKANLDSFLVAPGKLVPGTRMVMTIPDAGQRKAVVNYIATLK